MLNLLRGDICKYITKISCIHEGEILNWIQIYTKFTECDYI